LVRLTKRAHHAPTALYTHYSSLEEVLHQARILWVRRLNELEGSISLLESPLDKIAARLAVILEDSKTHPEFYRELMFRVPKMNPWPFTLEALFTTDLVSGTIMDIAGLATSGDLPAVRDPALSLKGFVMLVRLLVWLSITEGSDPLLKPPTLATYISRSLGNLLWAEGQSVAEMSEVLDRTADRFVERSASAGRPSTSD
jgi:AcrR family transcriptional regulator